jgi:beta-glucosidase
VSRHDSPQLFPADFLWGAATSAYQIEGSPLADGAGPSNWHRFCHQAGNTHDGETGDVACDHYRRWAGDVALMKDLDLQSYRFSISWSRIFPAGTGAVNTAGLDFYDKLVDGLLAAGIQPNATLYHWDLPAALDDRGGWAHPDAPAWFADYACSVFERLGDRVAMWSTFNEPWVTVDAGYVHGVHAPGHRDLKEAALVVANLLRAHGRAVQVYRGLDAALRAAGDGRIGIVLNLEPKDAASEDPADQQATVRADAYMNRQYLEPLLLGKFPTELAEVYGPDVPQLAADDFALLTGSLDFLGINYYTRSVTGHDETALPVRAVTVKQPDALYTDLDWEVHPESLTELLVRIRDLAGELPLYITENGAAFPDPAADTEGHIRDELRVAYFREHLRAVQRAIAVGVNVRGYYAWSLFDNFEWACGYAKRFGIVGVDYETQRRTIKDSGLFYRRVIRTNGGVTQAPQDPRLE